MSHPPQSPNPFGQNPPPYGQQPPPRPPYGQPQYGQQPPYGPQYGGPGGPNNWGPGKPGKPGGGNTRKVVIIGLVATFLLVVVSVGHLISVLVRGASDRDESSRSDDPTGVPERYNSTEANELLASATSTMAGLESVRARETYTYDGVEFTFDVLMDNDRNCVGTVRLTQGGEAEYRVVEGQGYIRGDEDYYSAASKEGLPYANKWMKEGSGDSSCDIDNALESADDTSLDTSGGGGEITEIDGTQVVEVSLRTDQITMYVDPESPHYILRTDFVDDDEKRSVTFSDFNEPVEVTAPPPDEVGTFPGN